MSQENVERLRASLEAARAAYSESDRDGWLYRVVGTELWDPEIEWDCSAHPVPDLAGVFKGEEAVLEWWRQWLAAWEVEATGIEYELVDAGDRVVALINMRMRGRSTGIEVVSGRFAMLYTFRDGLVVRARFYGRWSEALEAVGQRE
jgi:ketosteroid isomerase-like protein